MTVLYFQGHLFEPSSTKLQITLSFGGFLMKTKTFWGFIYKYFVRALGFLVCMLQHLHKTMMKIL